MKIDGQRQKSRAEPAEDVAGRGDYPGEASPHYGDEPAQHPALVDEPLAPRRKRRRDGAFVGYLSGVFTFLTLAAIAGGGVLYWGKTSFDGPGPLAQDTTVLINRNQGVDDIAETLTRAGVIDQPKVFEFGVRVHGANDKLRYGEYAFPARVSMREAMEILTSGKAIEHTVTIPEGLTSLQVVERLRGEQLLIGDVKQTPPEGSLLPETYKFTRGASREQIIARMQQHQKAALEEIWKARTAESPIKSPEELVILASMVEKETGVAEERGRVAAVFVNRLNKGMRLQSDPTIVYGIVGGRGTLGRSLTRADITNPSKYNTYVVRGLPAGPIANPGRLALEAAANPPTSTDLYFVADGSGGHAFAPSLVEHNKNVAKWRQIERARGAAPDRLDPTDARPESAGADGAAAPAAVVSPSGVSSSSGPPRLRPADRRRPPDPLSPQ